MPTIRVSEETNKRLKRIGEFGESYDDVIIELLDFFEENADAEVDDEEVELK